MESGARSDNAILLSRCHGSVPSTRDEMDPPRAESRPKTSRFDRFLAKFLKAAGLRRILRENWIEHPHHLFSSAPLPLEPPPC